MKIITISSIKGGEGKSTLIINLSLTFLELGKTVLVIDLDSNNNATDFFLRFTELEKINKNNAYHWITKQSEVSKCIHHTDFANSSGVIDIIPCTVNLCKAGVELSSNPASLLRLKRTLNQLDYDIVLADTPPSLTFEMRSGLHIADIILTPLSPSRWSAQSLGLLQDEIDIVEESHGIRPKLLAIPSMVTKSEQERVRQVDDSITMTKHGISRAAAIRSAVNKGKALRENTKSWLEFRDLAKEILKKV